MLLGFVSCGDKANVQLGSIYGEVTDKTTGSSIANAGIELQPTGDKATTGSDGHFEFANLQEGTYTLIVTKTGYNRYEAEVTVGSEEKKRKDIQLEKALTSIVVVDNNQKEVNTIDFGSDESPSMRSVTLANKSEKTLDWQIKHENVTWIKSINPSSGTLNINTTQSVTITIDRSQLPNAENSALIHISSAEGSKDITIKASKKKIEVVETFECSNITSTSATFNGQLNDDVNGSVYRYGFVYDITPSILDANSTVANVVSFSGNPIGPFSYKAEYLNKDRTYYVRAFAQTKEQIYYGRTLNFTTKEEGGQEVITYYIKHPWNGGEWTWHKMNSDGEYYGLWGGVGANINTEASDKGSKWFSEDEIEFYNNIHLSIGERAVFIYVPEDEILYVAPAYD